MKFIIPLDTTHQARLVVGSHDARERRRIARHNEAKRARDTAAAAERERQFNTVRTYDGDETPEVTAQRMDALINRAFNAHNMVRVFYFEEVGDRFATMLDGYLEGFSYTRTVGHLTEIKIGTGHPGAVTRIPTSHIRAISIVG